MVPNCATHHVFYYYGITLGSFVSSLNVSFISRIEVTFPESKLRFQLFVPVKIWSFISKTETSFPESKQNNPNLKLRFQLAVTIHFRSLVSRTVASFPESSFFPLESNFRFWKQSFEFKPSQQAGNEASNLICFKKLGTKLRFGKKRFHCGNNTSVMETRGRI